ncbi:MAG: ATP-binding protein [Acidimicrobiales bacterium]|nr:ATP-binding protein [Acidimicrobiales bacterium]
MEAEPRRSWRWARSLRVRTTVVSVGVVGVALLVGGVSLVILLRGSLTDQVRTAAELRAADVASVLESGTPPEDLAVDDEEDLLIQVVDASGDVVSSSENVEGEPRLASLGSGQSRVIDSTPISDENHSFLLVAEDVDAPTGRFTVLVGRSTEIVTESTGLVVTVLAGGLPLLLLLVGAISWRVVGRTLAPVDSIRREVEEISASELHRRVPASATDDEIARLAATMNRMLDRLETSHDRQRRFVSDASHELRSPVATIRQHAEVALAHPASTTMEELAEVVLVEDLRVQRLVEDLLLLARADENTLQVNRRPVDVDDLVFEEADRVRAVSGHRVDVSGVSAGRVDGDPAQLRRVIRNLADNAIRHADSSIRLSLTDAGERVVFTIDDDGHGIETDTHARIFERFVRLDEARARDDGGSGLGLAIVAEIVGAHGGSVHAEDSTSGGARFVVSLPTLMDG